MRVLLRTAEAVFDFLSSLRLAVPVMLALMCALITATCLESLYDTATAQYWVYKSGWFHGILLLLGVNILCVALSRLPWKRHHAAFLLAHAGIILMLVGSWVTQQFGLDGSLRLQEGETASIVEENQPVLVVVDGSKMISIPVDWVPPNATFRPFGVSGYPLRVEEMISHADATFEFEPSENPNSDPAIELKIEGGPMRIVQNFWLWGGDPTWAKIQAGPATLRLVTPKFPRAGLLAEDTKAAAAQPAAFAGGAFGKPGSGPVFTAEPSTDGKRLKWEAKASDGKIKKGELALDRLPSQVLETGWKGGVTITVTRFFPRSQVLTVYKPSKILYGQNAPPSAIRLRAGAGPEASSIWLGLGDRAVMTMNGRDVPIGYYPKRVNLPFPVALDRFDIEHYEGTNNPKEYSSRVRIPGTSISTRISMNEPLVHGGITFYQASYEDAKPRPTVSVLSVNRDPGRQLKYWGSLLLVLGIILLFAQKLKLTKRKTTS